MYFGIQHQTRFRYDSPVSESLMELRMQPRTEASQRCHSFLVKVSPKARVMSYRDHLGNHIHHFNVAAKHSELLIVTESMVETFEANDMPQRLDAKAWKTLDDMVAKMDYWEFLMPSEIAKPTPLMDKMAEELDAFRRDDPLTMLHELNAAIFETFDYVPKVVQVSAPVETVLEERKGGGQDLSHIMLALVRRMGIPCRYVSGYLYRQEGDRIRSTASASHAWVEALLPDLGWTGFDPTNRLLAGERHIRMAIGRDYNDVPPTKGVYRGNAQNELSVLVHVRRGEAPMLADHTQELQFNAAPPVFGERPQQSRDRSRQQQQQQQQ
jgi:transglutaminase-like putative cysteine protease